jgi:calcineurin-like phosphoesterase family protein
MKFFAIADLHFGHTNIIKYCDRPFEDTDEMDRVLIKNWNETVSNNDTVLVLGDVGFGSKEYIASLIKQLNGKKILIMGNHDNWSEQTYRDMGFHTVSRFPILWNDFYLLSHAPLILSETTPYFNLYGHVHNDSRYVDTASSKCVSVERIGYRPFFLFEKN